MRAEKYPRVTLPQRPPEKVLKGQKARVTGAASGVGKAVAVARGPAGAEVVVNDVRDRRSMAYSASTPVSRSMVSSRVLHSIQ